MTEPRVRKDGKCANCRKPKPVLKQSLRRYCGDQYDRDPFCSAFCARQHYGVPIAGDEEPEALRRVRSEAGQKARVNFSAVRAGY